MPADYLDGDFRDPSCTLRLIRYQPQPEDEADRFGIRLAIGLENAGDLIGDLEAGFQAWGEGLKA